MPAIRVHHTATSDDRWDGPGSEARLKNDAGADYYRAEYAWQSDGASNKGDFKFPHHEVSDSGSIGAANIRACVSGIAVLNGGRGGASIPDADREGVYRHLAAHIKDSGGTPPELKAMKTTETKMMDLHLEVKALGDDGVFSGDLSVYDFVDYGGDVTVKGCFTKTLQESGGKIPMLNAHDMARPIGVMYLNDGESSLEAKGVLNMDVADAQQVHSMMRFNMKHGIKTGLSMGYITVKDAVKSGIRYLQEVKLLEGSVVTLAANRLCAVTEVKKRGAEALPERKDFAEELEEVQVCDLFYQIVSALYCELCNSVYMSDAQADAEAGVKQAFSDAETAFLDFVGRYFALQSNSDAMQYMNFPETPVAQKMLMDLETRIKALLVKSRATSPEADAATETGAATQPNEPGPSHSNDEKKTIFLDNFVKEIFDESRRDLHPGTEAEN